MTKLITVESCKACPYFEGTSRMDYCRKDGEILPWSKTNTIPSDCPLPDNDYEKELA